MPSRARPVLAAVALGLLVIFVLSRWPVRADGAGTFDECQWGWPVVTLDGTALYLPVMSWPAGVSYDTDRQIVLDGSGAPVVSKGARVVVRGTIRDMRGSDIPPCFVTRGIDLEGIAPG